MDRDEGVMVGLDNQPTFMPGQEMRRRRRKKRRDKTHPYAETEARWWWGPARIRCTKRNKAWTLIAGVVTSTSLSSSSILAIGFAQSGLIPGLAWQTVLATQCNLPNQSTSPTAADVSKAPHVHDQCWRKPLEQEQNPRPAPAGLKFEFKMRLLKGTHSSFSVPCHGRGVGGTIITSFYALWC